MLCYVMVRYGMLCYIYIYIYICVCVSLSLSLPIYVYMYIFNDLRDHHVVYLKRVQGMGVRSIDDEFLLPFGGWLWRTLLGGFGRVSAA